MVTDTAEIVSPEKPISMKSTAIPISVRSPWLSVSDMLIQNKCWICMSPFQRGYKKKVFLVSQLISCLIRLRKESILASENNLLLTEITSTNLKACYDVFLTLNGDETKLTEELKKYDVANWLSGLVCCRSVICKEEYGVLIPSIDTDTTAAATEAAKALRETFIERAKTDINFCPPDCGCDNPWPFLS